MMRWIVVLLALVCAAPAAAHTRSETHSSWSIDGSSVHLDFTVPQAEAARVPKGTGLITYLVAHVGVKAGEVSCAMTGKARPVFAAAGYDRVEMAFSCPSLVDMHLHSDAFFDLVPTHITFAQIQDGHGEFFEQIFTASNRDIAISGSNAANRLENADFLAYIGMGVMHIFTGIDHMSFLLGLVLISRRFRDLLFVITGFTVGHSLTLALAVTGLVRPHAEFIDALVALTIMMIGAENIAAATRRPELIALVTGGALLAMAALRMGGVGLLPASLLLGAGLFAGNYILVSGHVRDAGRLRMVITLVFGLIHGFGFAADLLESRIPTEKLVRLLVGFNLGVEIGQVSVVSAVVGFVWVLRRYRLALPRPIVVDVTASCLVALGTGWFISRSF